MAEVYTESWVEGDNTMQDLKTSNRQEITGKKKTLKHDKNIIPSLP